MEPVILAMVFGWLLGQLIFFVCGEYYHQQKRRKIEEDYKRLRGER